MGLFQKETIADHTSYKREWNSSALYQEIEHAKTEIEDAYRNFQNTSDPDLIDCYIFRGNAAFKRYQFLLKQAKML